MRTVSSLFLTLLLSSCATLDKDECATADWYAIGLEALTRESQQLESRIQDAVK